MENKEARKILQEMHAERVQNIKTFAVRIADLAEELKQYQWEETAKMMERLRERSEKAQREADALALGLRTIGFEEGDEVIVNVPGESEHGKRGTVLAVWETGKVLVRHHNVDWTYAPYELRDAE